MVEALQTSRFIDDLLKSLNNFSEKEKSEFKVHSMYERTINIKLGSQLIALQTKGSPLSPISIILPINKSDMDNLKITKASLVTVNNGQLIIGDNVINISDNTFKYDSHLISYNVNEELSELIGEMLIRTRRGGFSKILLNELVNDDIALKFAKKQMLKCITIIDNVPVNKLSPLQVKNFIENIITLIGVGTGLTPSGDDFICGILAAMTNSKVLCDSNLHNALRKAVNSNLERTNTISAAFLRCAANSDFSLPVISLLEDANSTKIYDYRFVDRHLNDFLAVGHSSGMDTLSGMYWSMGILF